MSAISSSRTIRATPARWSLFARIGSLIPASFENPSGGVFLSQSLEPITSAVPEPDTVAMLLAGLVLVESAAARRHGHRRQA